MQIDYVFGIWSNLVKFVYEDHQVKVKVIGSKSVSLCRKSYILPVSFINYFFQTAERPRRKYIRGWILNQGRKIDSGILPIPPLLFTEGAEPAQTSLRLSILPWGPQYYVLRASRESIYTVRPSILYTVLFCRYIRWGPQYYVLRASPYIATELCRRSFPDIFTDVWTVTLSDTVRCPWSLLILRHLNHFRW